MSILLYHCNIVLTIPIYPFNQVEITELVAELLQERSKRPNQAREMYQTPLLKPLKENLLHALE